MHLLRLFFMAWLGLGVASIFFLFWLCKRTDARKDRLPEISTGTVTSASVFMGDVVL